MIAVTTLSDWLKNLTPVCQPMTSKTKANRTLYARLFPRLEQVAGNREEFWLVHRAVYPVVIGHSDCFGNGFSTPYNMVCIGKQNSQAEPED